MRVISGDIIQMRMSKGLFKKYAKFVYTELTVDDIKKYERSKMDNDIRYV